MNTSMKTIPDSLLRTENQDEVLEVIGFLNELDNESKKKFLNLINEVRSIKNDTSKHSIFGDPERFALAFHGMTFKEFVQEVYKSYNETGEIYVPSGIN